MERRGGYLTCKLASCVPRWLRICNASYVLINWVLGARHWVLSSWYCCWGFWALGSDVRKKHDVGKTGWNHSRHHVDECNLTKDSDK